MKDKNQLSSVTERCAPELAPKPTGAFALCQFCTTDTARFEDSDTAPTKANGTAAHV